MSDARTSDLRVCPHCQRNWISGEEQCNCDKSSNQDLADRLRTAAEWPRDEARIPDWRVLCAQAAAALSRNSSPDETARDAPDMARDAEILRLRSAYEAALNELEATGLELIEARSARETTGWCPRCDCDYCGAMQGKAERAAVEPADELNCTTCGKPLDDHGGMGLECPIDVEGAIHAQLRDDIAKSLSKHEKAPAPPDMCAGCGRPIGEHRYHPLGLACPGMEPRGAENGETGQ